MSENNRAESDSESESDDDIRVTIKRKAPRIAPYHRIPYVEWAARKKGRFFNFNTPPRRDDPHPGIPINTTRPPDVSIEDWNLPWWARPGFVPTAFDKYWGFIQVKSKDPNVILCRGRKETTRAHRYNLRPRGIITNKNPLKKHRYVLRSKLN